MEPTRLFTRAVVRLSPLAEDEDVAAFLQGLVTNDVVGGVLPVYAGLLSPQGKVLFDFLVWKDRDDLLLDCEAQSAEALAKRLSLYRLRRKISIAVAPEVSVHWSPVPPPSSAKTAHPDPRLPALGTRWLAAASPKDQPADDAWLAHRLAHGVCEGRAELGDGETLWLEANAAELNGVSFTKGCYVGQENTARMNWRQKVNRRLIVVPLAISDPARQRAAYPALGLAVDHLRVEDITPAMRPVWLPLD